MKSRIEKRELRCVLSDDEIAVAAKESARLVSQIVRLKGDKKTVMKNFTTEIDWREAKVTSLSTAIDVGHIDREVDVKVLFDDPKVGQKTSCRLDTGEVLETTYMTDAERQYCLNLTDEKEDEAVPEETALPVVDGEEPKYDDKDDCPICNGRGSILDGDLICPTCNGTKKKRLN